MLLPAALTSHGMVLNHLPATPVHGMVLNLPANMNQLRSGAAHMSFMETITSASVPLEDLKKEWISRLDAPTWTKASALSEAATEAADMSDRWGETALVLTAA